MSIREWEILNYPTEKDPNRYRISLASDGIDVARLRNLFPGRVGTVWIPRRKPFNCAFFLYRISSEEKEQLEEMLKGELPFPDTPEPFLEVQPLNQNLSKEDTQEVDLLNAVADRESSSEEPTVPKRTVRLAYFYPDHFPEAESRVHDILTKIVLTKKIAVQFEKIFGLNYQALSLTEIQALIKKCKKESVTRVIAIGEPVHLTTLQKIALQSGILIKPIAESVLDKNLWYSLILELVSHGD